jgi:hypothetical protein
MKKPRVGYSGKLVQVVDGNPYKWYERKNGTYVEVSVCCDCQLVHIIEMKPNDGYIRVKVWRDDEKTKELREKRK